MSGACFGYDAKVASPRRGRKEILVGAGLGLVVIGAILAFAVTDHLKDVNLFVVGLILMLAGAAVIANAKRTAERQRVFVERDTPIEPLHPADLDATVMPMTHVVEETELEEVDRLNRRD